jgi:uncharacterized protein YggE
MKVILLTLLIASGAFAKETKLVQVQGTCKIKVTPDQGSILFTAENDSKNQKDAVSKSTKQINELREKIKKFNLKHLELKTTNYNVYPIREYENNRYVDKGMRASLALEVTTSEIMRLGEVMALASELNIKNVGQLQTFLSLDEEEKTYLKCLDIASQNAKVKAQQLAKELDFKLGSVEQIIEGQMSLPTPVPMMARGMVKSMMAMDSAGAPPIEAGTQEFGLTLTVTFGIK